MSRRVLACRASQSSGLQAYPARSVPADGAKKMKSVHTLIARDGRSLVLFVTPVMLPLPFGLLPP